MLIQIISNIYFVAPIRCLFTFIFIHTYRFLHNKQAAITITMMSNTAPPATPATSATTQQTYSEIIQHPQLHQLPVLEHNKHIVR